MQESNSTPKRHHYIPQMILRHFSDTDGDLWFWRRNFSVGEIRKTATKNLFVEKDLYTQIRSDGSKDAALEQFFADLEGIGADFIRKLAEIVRGGRVPKLDDGAWDFWHHFFYYQIKRTPGYLDALAERSGFKASVSAAVKELKEKEAAGGLTEGHEDLEGQIYKNATVFAQGVGPSAEVSSLFASLGMVIYRIVDSRKSFVVGDVPGASTRIRGLDDTVSGQALFIPLTHDLALGYLRKPKAVEIVNVDQNQVRRMNEATAARSMTIAGRSSELLSSLSRAVEYVGVISIADDSTD